MNLLAFDTSTDVLSLAAQRGDAVCTYSGPGGAQASACLIPRACELLAQAGLSFTTLDAIVFGRGPGSFTGLRTACSVAQGLAFGARDGAGIPVLAVDTLLAVAEQARHDHGCVKVVAALDARMNEVYVARFEWHPANGLVFGHWQADSDFVLCAPEAVDVPAGWSLAGNARAAYGDRLARGAAQWDALPTAAALLRLAPALIAAGDLVAPAEALPRYIRDKVAQTTSERSAMRAAQVAQLHTAHAPAAP